ncbi:MAG: outer membrane lipoprotein-sorting protein [Reinekea sp.]|nr:outer membrane lipoprotein-sorting protein [Reinekea sp.]
MFSKLKLGGLSCSPLRVSAMALALSVSVMPAASVASDLSAREIMEKVDARDTGESSLAVSTMILVDKHERKRERQLKQLSKEYEAETKSVVLFETPTELKGTVYLNYNWVDADLDNDSWLYLPALGAARRVASADQSGAFLGSDFSYADVNGFELEWYDYELIEPSVLVDGHDCWLIEYTPKSDIEQRVISKTGNIRTRVWIRKDILMLVKSQIWQEQAGRIKFFKASEISEIENIWTAMTQQMVTTRNGKLEHSTVLQTHSIKYNIELEDRLFTVANMQRDYD